MQDTGTRSEGTLDTHLAYNLIRTIMAQAAKQYGIEPRSISFKGTVQTLDALKPIIALRGQHDAIIRRYLYQQLLEAITIHRVGDRPDHYEPRQKNGGPNRVIVS